MEDRLGADEDTGRARGGAGGAPEETSSTGSPTSAATSSAARVVPSRSRRRRVEEQVAHTNGRELPQTEQCSDGDVPAELDEGSSAALAPHDRPAGTAGEQPRPARPVEHADDGELGAGSAPVPHDRGETRTEKPGPRVVPAPVDHLDRGPSGLLRAGVEADERRPDEGGERRTGAHLQARHAGATGPLGREDRRVPRRGALFDVGLRVGVEDDDDAEPRDLRERRSPCADDGATSRRRVGPRLGLQRHLAAEPGEPLGEHLGVAPGRHENEGVTVPGGGERRPRRRRGRGAAGGRRRTADPDRQGPSRRLGDRRRARLRPGRAGRPAGRQGADQARRRPGEQERPQPAGVTPSAEPPEPDDLGGGPRRHESEDLPQLVAVGLACLGDDPAAHLAAVQRDPHDRAELDRAGEGIRHGVGELPVDAGDVGEDRDDPPGGRSRPGRHRQLQVEFPAQVVDARASPPR